MTEKDFLVRAGRAASFDLTFSQVTMAGSYEPRLQALMQKVGELKTAAQQRVKSSYWQGLSQD